MLVSLEDKVLFLGMEWSTGPEGNRREVGF